MSAASAFILERSFTPVPKAMRTRTFLTRAMQDLSSTLPIARRTQAAYQNTRGITEPITRTPYVAAQNFANFLSMHARARARAPTFALFGWYSPFSLAPVLYSPAGS